MSFDELWGQARSNAVARQHSNMRLNQLPADVGGSAPGKKLVADSGFLMNRATKADTVRDDFVKVDDSATKETSQVGASLKGFKSGPAFSTFLTRWREQVKYVENLLKNDIAGTLRSSANEYAAREEKEKSRHSKEKLK
ncbi:hypothetical protein ACFOOM_32885 [Streptomyces echinoruber]|uniref:Uncharacterized protein n=1 Tax=Streptomyces echinoruber TaxID=68898 RepID=A0A918RWR9_9ACTN|nr:hypothetical protein [Streptomyces echinoruber]GHA13946.1 hypothetical protein GCM10010389_60940 [Streptomyces echinoruber]